MQGIEIPIGAPLGQLDKDLKNATSIISNFATTTTGKFALINKTKFTFGQNFISEADKLASKGKGLGDNLSGPLVKGSNQAAFALQNLGRVAQDAPFGFIGIQNNLNPLLESFQQLKQQTGSTSSAFKALGQSLIGPAGLGIALSIVSAGILFYQQYQQRANKETEKAKKTNEDYASTLEAVNRIQLVGAQNAVKETTELKALFSAYQNANLPLKQRKDAYSELQKQYPEYFGNLKFEEQASEKVKSAYDKLSESIIATGRARAGIDLITKNEQKKLENEQKLVDLQTEGNNLSIKKESLLKTSAELQRTSTREGAGISQLVQANSVQGDINANLKLQNQLKNDNKKIDQDNLRITKSINGEILKGGKVTGSVGGETPKSGKGAKDVQSVGDILAKLEIELQKVSNSVDITFGQGNQQKVKAFASAIDSLTEIKAGGNVIKGIQDRLIGIKSVEEDAKARLISFNTIEADLSKKFVSISKNYQDTLNSINKTPLVPFPTLLPQLKLISQQFIEWNKNISNIISGSLTQTFAGIGEAIGQSLATGTSLAQNLGNALLNSLGSVLGQLGQMAIATGVALLGIQTALKTLNPFAAIAAGVALLALSGVVKGKASKLGGSMGGGGSSGGNFSAPVPQASSTISTSAAGSAQDFGGGRVVFEISGTNLIGVLNRAGAKLQRFG
jgi:hypothetical protein